MNKKVIIAMVLIGVSLLVGVRISMKKNVDKPKDITSVNNKGISKAEYEKKVEEAISFFKWQKQDISQISTLQKDALDRLVDESLISQYAEKNKISVSEGEVNSRYEQAVAGYNRRSKIAGGGDSAFLSKIKEMYGNVKSDYLLTLKMDILKEKVQAAVKMPLAQWLKTQKESAEIKVLN